jgi:hypothetical protein
MTEEDTCYDLRTKNTEPYAAHQRLSGRVVEKCGHRSTGSVTDAASAASAPSPFPVVLPSAGSREPWVSLALGVNNMPVLHRSVATLRIMGDDLIPAEITKLLGSEPTESQAKGDQIIAPKTGNIRIARSGMWRLHATEREPEDINGQVNEVLDKLTCDLNAWTEIAQRFKIDFFCGLFMDVGNEGIELSPQTMILLGQRGIKLGLDIYAP